MFGDNVFPKFSILNPVLTYTIPQYQMVAGFFDVISHILEQYFSNDDENTSDYIMEGLLKSLIYSSRIAIKNPTDYEARSNIMWTASNMGSQYPSGKREVNRLDGSHDWTIYWSIYRCNTWDDIICYFYSVLPIYYVLWYSQI